MPRFGHYGCSSASADSSRFGEDGHRIRGGKHHQRMLEEEFDLDDDQPKHQESLNLRKAKRPVQSAVVGQTSVPCILKQLSLLQEAIDRNKYLANWQKWHSEDPSDLNRDATTPENVAMPNKVVPFNLDGHNSPFGAGACGVGDPRRLAFVMSQQSMENLGQLLSERGELRNVRNELEERQTEIVSTLKSRGYNRRNFAHIAALVSGGARLPFYNEAAVAQLSMRPVVPADADPFSEDVEAMFVAVTGGDSSLSAERAKAIYAAIKRWAEDRALFKEFVAIVARLSRVNRALCDSDALISRALAKQRSSRKRCRNIVAQQRPFFIMNSFHPPDAALTATASAFGGFAMAA